MMDGEANGDAGGTGGTGQAVLKTLRWVAFAACVGLFVHALGKADLHAAWARIRALGPVVLLVLLPFPAGLAMDAWAWRNLLLVLGRKVPLLTLFKVRLATEAITNSAPIGALWADAIAPILVARRALVPTEDVFAASTAKRWTVVRMHGTYVACSAAFGVQVLTTISQHLFHTDVLEIAVLASALGLVLLSLAIEALAARGRIAERVSGALGNARFVWLKKWIASRRHHFARADAQLARLSKDPRAGFQAAWRMLGLWLIEGLESVVIFKLLGAPLGVVEVLAIDASLSVVRSSAMFAPGGIGIQDVGYLALLEAYGVPGASSLGPAFIVVKRLKEAFWIAVGFVVLARSGPREVIKKVVVEIKQHSVPPDAPLPPATPP